MVVYLKHVPFNAKISIFPENHSYWEKSLGAESSWGNSRFIAYPRGQVLAD